MASGLRSPELLTIVVTPFDGTQLSITTDDANEAARWLLRIVIQRGLFRNINPINGLRDFCVFGDNVSSELLASWADALRTR